MLLGSKIALVTINKGKTKTKVIFESVNNKFSSLHADSKQKILLVEGTSLLLVGFDEIGVSYTRLLKSNKLGKARRLLCWDPVEEIILISQKFSQKRENIHILSYKNENCAVAASILNVPSYGNYYEEDSQSFFLIEDDEERQMISYLSPKDFHKSIEGAEQPVILEGEGLTYMPTVDHQHDSYNMTSIHGILVVRPTFSNEKVFIR